MPNTLNLKKLTLSTTIFIKLQDNKGEDIKTSKDFFFFSCSKKSEKVTVMKVQDLVI